MPNHFREQDRLTNHNGRYRSGQALYEENLSDVSTTSEVSLSPPKEDWSPLTKELIDTLPRVWTRGLLYLLVVFTGIILPWAMLSKVDETGSARGRLEPKGDTLRLDTPVGGTVTKVSAKEGQTVETGQVLMELESDLLRSELQEVQTKLEGQLNRRSQLEVIKNQLLIAIRAQQQQNQAQELEKQAQIQQARASLSASQTAYTLQQEKLAQIEQARAGLTASKTAYTLQQEKLAQIEQARRSLSASQTAYALADSRLAKDMAEVERFRKLFQDGIVPEIKVVEKQQQADESLRLRQQAAAEIKQAQARLQEQQGSYQRTIHQARAEIEQAQARLKEQQGGYQKITHQARAEIEQAQSRLKEQESGHQSLVQAGKLAVLKSEQQLKDLETQITTLKAEISQSQSQIQSLKFQLGQRLLRSPTEGTIFQMPIQRAGAVVEPGQTIAQIAPKEAVLIFKAQMPTSESGFMRTEMPVKLKFDAYPFQDYGVAQGRLRWISPNSKILETPQGKIEIFELEIALDRPYIQNQNKQIPLTPGQTATAEVVVRQRRVIDFILDPFKKLQKGGLEL